MAEQRNTQITERVDAQTQTDTTPEDLTLSQKLTALTHPELQPESAAQLAPPPPPPPSSTTTTNTPLDKFDKDLLRWKDVHFLRDFGDWFDPEKAVQPTYTRLLSSCGYIDPNSPLDSDLVEDHIPPLDFVEDHNPALGVVDNSDTSIPNQGGRGLIIPDVNVGRDFVLGSEMEDSTAVEHTPTDDNTQTARSTTVTVGPSINNASVEDTLELDSDPTDFPAKQVE